LTLQEANGDTSGAESPSIQAWLAARLKGRAKTLAENGQVSDRATVLYRIWEGHSFCRAI
jgi:hypothetical protein